MKKTASISARISPETKERLQAYAQNTDQTSSQLLEKAINHYLDETQNVTQNVVQNETHDVTQNVGQTEIPDKSTLEKRLGALEAEVRQMKANTNVEAKKLNQLDKNAIKIPDMEGVGCALYQDELRDRVEALENAKNNEPPASEEKSEGIEAQQQDGEAAIPQDKDKFRQHSTDSTDDALTEEDAIAPMTQEALGKRLNISGRGLANHREKGDNHLMEWSRERDPDGIAWKYENKKYHPA